MYICIYFTPNLERHAAWIVRTSICLCVGIAGSVFVISLERNVNSTDCLLRSKISILVERYSPRAEGFLLVNNIAEEIVAMDGQLGQMTLMLSLTCRIIGERISVSPF